MTERYTLTPKQARVLRSLRERMVEATPVEVAVSTLTSPAEARGVLAALQQYGLVKANPYLSDEKNGGDAEFELTDEGQAVGQALALDAAGPSVGAVVRLPRSLPSFMEWLSPKRRAVVEIVPEAD